tara:strand:+ start:60 stop:239 length:180 start_codon:yes stop_codon:yes gene_type:complete
MHFGFFVGHCTCDWRFEQLIQMIKSADMAEVLSIQEHHLKYKKNPRYDKIERALKERLG